MAHTPASVFVVKSWAEKGVGRKRMPDLHFGPSANSQGCFMWVSIWLPKERWRRMWLHCHAPCQLQTSSQFLWSTFPQIRFLPGKTLTISYSTFNQQQLVLANGSGHCLGLHMISIQKKTNFYSNQTHMLNTWAPLLDIIKLRQFLSFI